ncbi:MAG: glucose-1-phosphate cytidylyltransferase [Deltaproteobacteria bacterium]|nr:glucose-1-phosphate cytidylyltransferase [Deltaproteobacteria bacterium]MBI3391421.1 glucose-1-phosphate cytidylyltransferase [Deltaproteobacteria bacterium]
MKVVILAGGLGTRLAEETEVRPKPMVEIGHRPILWHIMKHYARYGFKEFYLALGYKGEQIKRFFLDYRSLSTNMTVSLKDGTLSLHDGSQIDDWVVHLIDTGVDTNTGGRVKQLAPLLANETFMMTYGDGVADVDLTKLVAFHRSQGRLATLTAVRPAARFGALTFDGPMVTEFREKPQMGEGWINGGFMVLEPGVMKYIEGDASNFEYEALERLAAERQLVAYKHERFWQCMDTMRDLKLLRRLWDEQAAPWKTWT